MSSSGTVSHLTQSLMKEVEQTYERNQQLKNDLQLAEYARLEAEEEAKNYKAEANTMLTNILQELDQLRQDTITAEQEIVQHRTRASDALEISRKKLQEEEILAIAREQEIKERIQSARNELSAIQNKANTLRTDIDSVQKYENEILVLKNRLGKYALPLHKELVQIHKDTKVSTEAANAEIARLKEQKERLSNDINTLAKEKESLTHQLNVAVQSQQTIRSLNDEYNKDNVNVSVLLQSEIAKAVRQGADMDTLFVPAISAASSSSSSSSTTATISPTHEHQHPGPLDKPHEKATGWYLTDTIDLAQSVASASLRNQSVTEPSVTYTSLPEDRDAMQDFVKGALLDMEKQAKELGINIPSSLR